MLQTPPPPLSIAAPCLNKAAVLAAFHRRVAAAGLAVGEPFEIVLTTDISRDHAWQVMPDLALCRRAPDVLQPMPEPQGIRA